jgi:hypothetical protein
LGPTCANRRLDRKACPSGKISSKFEAQWTDFFVPEASRGKGFFVYWIIKRKNLEGYPIRPPEHPLEPNIESKTYNFCEHCQQPKIRKYILEGRVADNLLIWNRRNGVDRILGCFENLFRVTEVPDAKYGKRCAFMAKNAFVLMDHEGIPLNGFAIRVEKKYFNLSNWRYTADRETTSRIIRKIKEKVYERKGLRAEDYFRLLSRYT